MHLSTFVDSWNTNSLAVTKHLDTIDSAKQGYRLRPSRLGRPAFVQAIEHLVYLHGNVPIHNEANDLGRTQDIFAVGHATEARIVDVMKSVGISGFDYQVPVSFDLAGYTIEGTADLVYDDTVIDIKTASSSNYKRLISGYGDIVYRTQLACYSKGLGLHDVALLLYNKDTSELYYKPVSVDGLMDRVESILAALKEMEDLTLEDGWNYVLETMSIPEPVPQMAAKKPTGRFLVPPELQYAPTVRDVLFHTEVHNGTRYVTSINERPLETITR